MILCRRYPYHAQGLVCTHTQPLRTTNGVVKLLASGTKQTYLKDQTKSRPSYVVSHHPECLVDDAPPQQRRTGKYPQQCVREHLHPTDPRPPRFLSCLLARSGGEGNPHLLMAGLQFLNKVEYGGRCINRSISICNCLASFPGLGKTISMLHVSH